MASNSLTQKCDNNIVNDINNDFNSILDEIVDKIDKYKGQNINKLLVKKWFNEINVKFNDKIVIHKNRFKSMGNKFSSNSTKMDDLFTTDLSPIKKQYNSVIEDNDSSDSDILNNTNGQQINESLDNDFDDNHNQSDNIEVESDSIEIVENIDNNMDYIDFLTDDNDCNESHINVNKDNKVIDHKIINNKNNMNGDKDDNENSDNSDDESVQNKDIIDKRKIINVKNCEHDYNSVKIDEQIDEEKEEEEEEERVEMVENDLGNYEEEVSQESDQEITQIITKDEDNKSEVNPNESENEEQNGVNLRPRKEVNTEKTGSDSSDVEFNDSSDSPQSDLSSNGDDDDFTLENKKVHRLSKYERAMNDSRLKLKVSVNLINLNQDLIEESYESATDAYNNVIQIEKKLFESLRQKGFICRKKCVPKSRPKDKEEDEEEKEMKRLCRIPRNSRLNIAINKRKSRESLKNTNTEESDCGKQSAKKMKTSSSDNDMELDDNCIASNSHSIDVKTAKMSNTVTLDSFASEVSSDEEKGKKDEHKKNIKTNKNSNEDESEDNEKSNENKSKTHSKHKLSKNIDKVLRNANKVLKEDKKESKQVIDIDSNSDEEEEVVLKKRVRKRRVSEDSYNENEKVSEEEEEESDSSSVIESSDGDPSAADSDEDSDTKSKKKTKKSSKQKSDKKKGRKRVITQDSSDEDEDEVKILSGDEEEANKSRKHIKKIISDKKLKQQTKDAAEAERDRRKRMLEKQKAYNELLKSRSVKSAEVKELILEFDKEKKEVLVEVDESLVKSLKPHQVNGIKFMYDCIVETLDQLETSDGTGCILAHSMGLGKTLQVIAFLHTILSHKIIGAHLKRALVICPVNTTRNWSNEFRIWLNDNDLDNILVFEMNDAKTMPQRGELLRIWQKRGGVLIMGLTLFASMVQGGRGKKPPKSVREAIEKCLLDPGPDIVICDEGHLLKNEKTSYNKAVSKLKTLRRVVLTGTPLQNNLLEYHVMVDFVKPNLLGTKKEFTNRFVNPITNGQHVDSTDYDVKIMKKRVHILHTLLNGCVHRCDYNVLVPYLQPKLEFVISVKLSDTQIDLYSYYLSNLTDKQRFSLLADYGVLRLVWNHPILLFEQHQRKLDKEQNDSMDEFIDDDEDDTPVSGDSDIECMDDNKPSTSKPRRRIRTRYGKPDPEEEPEIEEKDDKKDDKNDEMSNAWFAKYIKKEECNKIELSGKFILLFSILEECERLGDKILLFTQSLDTLDLVEELLRIKAEEALLKRNESIPEIDLESSHYEITNKWVKNVDYFRIDGSTGSDYRKAWIDIFNDENNYRARLFLLSTKAGGLGINLFGANRCIIFDASWNPTHDVQAIFRIFRFGQKKPVFVYRFVAQGTMEEKIYERQIIKQSLSCRVIDEQQIQRHFKASELSELYQFNPDRNKERPTPVLPKDRLLAELLIKHKEFIVNYHEHDSLLENKPEEDMTEDEKQLAWNEYEQEKDGVFLREQQERQLQKERELYLLQQQQAAQRYQQQQQQYAQQLYQYQQQFMANTSASASASASTSAANYGGSDIQSILQNQIYQNIMKSQANMRKQQQTILRQYMQQSQQQQPQPQPQVSQPKTPSNGLPGYDLMTVEDIAKYIKGLNSSIEPQQLIERIFSIIQSGIATCQKELQIVKNEMSLKPSDGLLMQRYSKIAKEMQNLNIQQTRANSMFKANVTMRTGPNILRPNTYQSQPTVIEPEDFTQHQSSSNKPSSVLIEEVD